MKLLKKEVKKMDMKKYSTILIGLFLLTQAVFAASSARTLPSSVSPGQTFTVTIPITMGTGVLGAGIVEMFPAGWTISSISTGGHSYTGPDRVEWIIFTGSNLTDTTASYSLTVPASATSGTASFAGNLSISTQSGQTTSAIGGSSSVNIVTTTTTTTSTTTTTRPGVYVERSMAATARQSAQVIVVLAINVDESKSITTLGIRETVPAGWAVSSVSNNGVYTASADKIEWIFGNYSGGNTIADQSISYVVTVPTGLTVGTIGTFTGVGEFYEGGVQKSAGIGGQQTIQVVKKKSSSNEFTLVAPSAPVANQPILVTIDDKDSKKGVKQAAVRVYLGKDENGKKVAYGQTDENGTFSFTVTDAGDYAIVTQKDSYKDLTVKITVASGAPTTTTPVTAAPTTTEAPVVTTTPIVTTTETPATTQPTVPPTTVTTETPPTTAEVTPTTVEVTTTTTPETGGGGMNMLLILVVVIIIVAAIAYFLMKGKGKATGNNKAATEKPKKTEAKEE